MDGLVTISGRWCTAVCTSGDAVQCVLGPAGSGKTYALAAAAQAWQKAGFTVWGASVNGTAAEQLARATAIPTRTLASLLNRLDLADHPVLTDRHVIVVDEASTIGSRNLARLLRHTTAAGATVRLVGDPAQHSAIDAGGLFRALVDRHPERTPVLTVLRRQAGDDMADIRLALTDYRQGRLAEAWQRLQDNARIVTALLDAAGHDLIGGDVGQLGGHDELRCVAGRVGRPTGRHRRLCGGAGCRAVAGGVAAQATVQVPRSRHEMSWWQGAVDQQGVARLQHTQEVAGDEWPVDGRVVHGAAAAGVEVGGDRPVADLLTAEYKARILDEYAALPVGSSERGALLRSEALYSSHLAEWRKARDAGAATPWPQRRSRVFPLEQVALERLRRRNERLETELAKTRSALDVIGKLHALLEGLSESADTDPKSTR